MLLVFAGFVGLYILQAVHHWVFIGGCGKASYIGKQIVALVVHKGWSRSWWEINPVLSALKTNEQAQVAININVTTLRAVWKERPIPRLSHAPLDLSFRKILRTSRFASVPGIPENYRAGKATRKPTQLLLLLG
jgi:hypothetical protein